MKLTNRVDNFFTKRPYLLYFLLFVIALNLFTFFQLDSTFADPDSFYHAKMAEILASRGAITQFPWLSATDLKDNFIDHHFLYHLILIPFAKFYPPLIGLKIATIIFASLVILTIFWFLRQLKIKGAFWYALFLLTVNPFIFRLNLAKAQQLVLILLFFLIYFLLRRNYLALILISCLYVWLYGGWPLVLLVVLIYSIINWFWVSKQKSGWLFKVGKLKVYSQNLLLMVSTALGSLAGIFFSPYFPKNLEFYWQQSFKIAIFNYQYFIGVGGEWYPYPFVDLFLNALPFFILYIFALTIFVLFNKKQSMNAWCFLVLSLMFFGLTLKSRRYVEYFIPLAVCFCALALNVWFDLIKPKLVKMFSLRLIMLAPLIIFLALSPVIFRDLKLIKESYKAGFSFNKFAEPMNWLKENSNQGEIIFHSDWDEFPLLFYHNDKNYYLIGLDPTFMYLYDKDLYQRWVDITLGEIDDNLYQTIKDVFGARYVFVDINQNPDFDRNLANNFYFEKVFENKEAKIYRLE